MGNRPSISYDREGTPGFWAADRCGAYYALGWLHGRHRALQTLLLATAARGELAQRLLPRADVVGMDALVHRLDLPRRGALGVERLDEATTAWLDAYIEGVGNGLGAGGGAFELKPLLARLPPPDRGSIVAGVMLSAYLGLAEGQERMERALIEAVRSGADTGFLQRMFAPHLQGWRPQDYHCFNASSSPLGFPGNAISAAGGSNAWAVTAARSASGYPLLAGDPHLQIDQLPSLFFEVRGHVGDDYWLGASIPGLPGLAVGRNRNLAWSGTFAVADNVDTSIEYISPAPSGHEGVQDSAVTRRSVSLRRRGRGALELDFWDTQRGTLETSSTPGGHHLAVRWAALENTAEALGAYMRLPFAKSVTEARVVLNKAHTLSLHFVLADREGGVRHKQVGRIPKRSPGWSGLYPRPGIGGTVEQDSRQPGPDWLGCWPIEDIAEHDAQDGIVASANEARPGPGGVALSTLAQPPYRIDRIVQRLRQRRDHDVASMCSMQADLYSGQAARLLPILRAQQLPPLLSEALDGWDLCYDSQSRGAHAFDLLYGAALKAMAEHLGGKWFESTLASTELRVWWCAALDRSLSDPASWSGRRGAHLRRAVEEIRQLPRPWGDVQRFSLKNLLLGGMPGALGFDRGSYPLQGSIGTVHQGNLVPLGKSRVAVGPAYRFVTDLGDDAALTALPGGIDGHPFGPSYDHWLGDYLAHAYHRIVPPEENETRVPI